MSMQKMRRRWKTMRIRGPRYEEVFVTGKHIVLRVIVNCGHDEHNCWNEYLIARFK